MNLTSSTRWLALNVFFIFAIYAGFILNNVIFHYGSIIFIWFMAAMYLICAISPDLDSKLRRRPMNIWLEWIVAILVFGMLLYSSAFITAMAYVAACLLLEWIYASGEGRSNSL